MVICNRYLFRSSPMKNPHSFSRFGGPRMGGQSCGVLPMTSSTVMFVGVHPPAPWHETGKTRGLESFHQKKRGKRFTTGEKRLLSENRNLGL